mmetsp:Transcript_46280/g.92524  ORF Transcript_46280/g.92524 Transcript_46280/m.92524 type:complete len:271 (+) Transcript_46280:53-865(+)
MANQFAVQELKPPTQNMMEGQALLPTAEQSDADLFRNLKTVLVKQEFAMAELCGIEVKNRYRVSPEDKPGGTFLYAKEQSECCERICCSPCRALTMNIYAGTDEKGPIVLTMSKKTHCPMVPCPVLLAPHLWPLTCPWICIAANDLPELTVRIGERVLGSIVDPPWPLFKCTANALIRDAAGQTLYQVGPTSLCNCGMVCACCNDMAVPVSNTSGMPVATITRKALSLSELFGKMNRFVVDFGSVSDPDERALVFAAAMLFDLQYWEQNQ